MKYIIAIHLKGHDTKKRFWKLPSVLKESEIIEKKTKALVNTTRGLQKVLILKVIEQETAEVTDKFTKKTFVPTQEVEKILKD